MDVCGTDLGNKRAKSDTKLLNHIIYRYRLKYGPGIVFEDNVVCHTLKCSYKL